MGNSKYFYLDCTLRSGVTVEQLEEALQDCRAHRWSIDRTLAHYKEPPPDDSFPIQQRMAIVFYTSSLSGDFEPLMKYVYCATVIRADLDWTDVQVYYLEADGTSYAVIYHPRLDAEPGAWSEKGWARPLRKMGWSDAARAQWGRHPR